MLAGLAIEVNVITYKMVRDMEANAKARGYDLGYSLGYKDGGAEREARLKNQIDGLRKATEDFKNAKEQNNIGARRSESSLVRAEAVQTSTGNGEAGL